MWRIKPQLLMRVLLQLVINKGLGDLFLFKSLSSLCRQFLKSVAMKQTGWTR
jgi:hypothetical protein